MQIWVVVLCVTSTAPEWSFQGPLWGVSDSRAHLTAGCVCSRTEGPQFSTAHPVLLQAALQVWTCPRHQHSFQATLKQSFLNSSSVSALGEDRSSQSLCHHSLWSEVSPSLLLGCPQLTYNKLGIISFNHYYIKNSRRLEKAWVH